MTACYLDASALVKLATPEPETSALRAHCLRYQTRVSSRLAIVEVCRALLRRGIESAALADAVTESFAGLAIVELDEGIAQHAARLGPATVRALDAIHLASALSIAPELDAFIAYDVRLADAARAAGLEVVAPR